jgi:hypothetical protein
VKGRPVKLATGKYKRVTVATNAELLQTVREYMVKSAAREARLAKEKLRGAVEEDGDGLKSDSDVSERPGSGTGTDDDDEDPNLGVGDPTEDGGKIADKRPQVPGDGDAASGTLAEQLSGAGYAPAVANRTVRVSAAGVPSFVGQVNPPGLVWNSVVPPEMIPDLKRRCAEYFQQLVGGSVDESDTVLEQLDPWQRFAVDIVLYHVRERLRAKAAGKLGRYATDRRPGLLRMILTGTSGSGKSRTIQAIVGQIRRMLRELGYSQEALLLACILSAPTGTAAFQMKSGGGTAHSTYGILIDHFRPLSDERLIKMRARLLMALLHIIDEYSMLSRAFLGKIDYRCGEVYGSAPEGFGGLLVSMGGRDLLLAGDMDQMPAIGGEQLPEDGPYRGKAQQPGQRKKKPGEAADVTYRGGGLPGPSMQELTDRGVLLRDEIQDAVILRNVHRLDDGNDQMSSQERETYRAEADEFADVTAAMSDLSWTRTQHRWLQGFSTGFLRSTRRGQQQLRELADAVVLMDCKKAAPGRQDAADTRNAAVLQEVAENKGVPIVNIRALHVRPGKERDRSQSCSRRANFTIRSMSSSVVKEHVCCFREISGRRRAL